MPRHSGPWPAGSPCWVECAVDDADLGSVFYQAMFGWEFTSRRGMQPDHLTAQLRNRDLAGFGPKDADDLSNRSAWTIYFATDNVDAATEVAVAEGGKPLVEPLDVGAAGRVSIVEDNQGSVFGLWQAREFTGEAIVDEPGCHVWSSLIVADPELAAAFYARVLGATIRLSGATVDNRPLFEIDGRPTAGLATLDPGRHASGLGWVPYFGVGDLGSALSAASGLGAETVGYESSVRLSGDEEAPTSLLRGPQGEMFGLLGLPDQRRRPGSAV